jgi:hypothetical protein
MRVMPTPHCLGISRALGGIEVHGLTNSARYITCADMVRPCEGRGLSWARKTLGLRQAEIDEAWSRVGDCGRILTL